MSEINGNSFENTVNDRSIRCIPNRYYRYMHTGPKIFKRWRNQFTVSHDSRYADEMDVLNVAIAQIIKYLPILCSFRLCIHSNEFQLGLGSVTLSICMRECMRVFVRDFISQNLLSIKTAKLHASQTHNIQYIRYSITRIDHSVCYCDQYSITFQRCFSIVQRCVFICVFDHSIQMTCELDLR